MGQVHPCPPGSGYAARYIPPGAVQPNTVLRLMLRLCTLPPLQAKIETAEAGGAPPGLLAAARATMQRLLLREVRAELDAVLKAARNKADKSAGPQGVCGGGGGE